MGSGAYTGKLTPQLIAEEQRQQAEQATPSADPAIAAAGPTAESRAAGSTHRKYHYAPNAAGKATSNGNAPSSSFSFVPEKQPEPKHEKGLQTGDLFNPPDQGAQV
jgi:hypothetical protein